MHRSNSARAARTLGALALLAALVLAWPLSAGAIQTVAERKLTDFKFPESVACDPSDASLYVSEFVSALKPTEKDGQGRISKWSLAGNLVEQQFLPPPGITLNKPKGIWLKGNRLWVTDIDAVWEFDLESKKGRKVDLPGIQFANDPTIVGDALYVSDNRGDALFKVEPAEFLDLAGEPAVSVVFSGKNVNPNGLYPAKDGGLYLVGFKSDTEARGVFKMAMGQDPQEIIPAIGRLDGIFETKEGDLLITDWNSGSLMAVAGDVRTTLAEGFKGPADFCVFPNTGVLTVVVPDLVASEVRVLRIVK